MMDNLRRAVVVVVGALMLAACGGGSDSSADANPPPPSTSTASAQLAPGVRQIASTDPAIVSESLSRIVFARDPGLSAGQVYVSTRTALKVAAVNALPDGTYAVDGTTPGINDVFATLSLKGTDVKLDAASFAPEPGVVLAMQGNRARPTAVVGGAITLNVSRPVGPAQLKLALSLEPTLTYDLIKTSTGAIAGIASLRTPISISPGVSISGGDLKQEVAFPLGAYTVNVPIPSLPIPGVVALKIPVKAVLQISAEKSELSVGINVRGDYGFSATFPGDSGAAPGIQSIGDGFTATVDGENIVSVGAQLGFTARAYLETGVSLSVMFGLTEPVAALLRTGLEANALLLNLTATNTEFNAECLRGELGLFGEGVVRLKGFPDAKLSLGGNLNIRRWIPTRICGAADYQRSFMLGDTSDESYKIANNLVAGSRLRFVPGTGESLQMSITGTLTPAPQGDPNLAFVAGTGTYEAVDRAGNKFSGTYVVQGWVQPEGRFSWTGNVNAPYPYGLPSAGAVGGLACTYVPC